MSNQKPPRTVSELFPSKWLHHDDLNGRTIVLQIKQVTFELLQAHPKTTDKILKGVVDFGRSKSLVMNQTQANAIADIVGSGNFEDWKGHRVALQPATSHNGRPTIKIINPPHNEPSAPAGDEPPDPDTEPEATAEAKTEPAEPQEFDDAMAYLETLEGKIVGMALCGLVVSLGFGKDIKDAEKKLLKTTTAQAMSIRQIFQRKFTKLEAKNVLTDLQEKAKQPVFPRKVNTVEEVNQAVYGA